MHVLPWAHRPPESITQTALRLVQPFLHSSWQSVVGHARHDVSPKLPVCTRDLESGPHLISNGSTDSASQKTHLDSAVFAQLFADKPLFQKMHLPMEWSEPHLIHIPLAHPSPQPKWHFDWLSHFCTAHCKVSLWFKSRRHLVFHHQVSVFELFRPYIYSSEKSCYEQKNQWSRFALILFKLHRMW